ncbi:hypothetical protein AB4481_01830, partial [Vibrio breoganii]
VIKRQASSFELRASSFQSDMTPTSKISNHRHTGKHMVFIQYLGECESQVWALSRVLLGWHSSFRQDDGAIGVP